MVQLVRSEKFRKLIEAKGKNRLLLFSLGQALFEEGKFDACLSPLQDCAQMDSTWMMPRILLGRAQKNLNRTEAAREWLESALGLAIDQNHDQPRDELTGMLDELDQDQSFSG
tara:strand:- start:490 stop:828 length:339 start_codon:yes stop_codon:yes gene_type:complete